MELYTILKALDDVKQSGMSKTASVGTEPSGESEKAAQLKQELMAAMVTATADMAQTEKVATAPDNGNGSATEGILKLAQDMAASDDDMLAKEATMYGAAMADGFMSRLQQYEKATQGMESKTAAAPTATSEDTFEKFAGENPELTKQAVELGYHQGKRQIALLKEAAYTQGYQEMVKSAAELVKTEEGRTKLAEAAVQIQAEAEKTAVEDQNLANLEKLASDTSEAGQQKLATALEELNKTPEGQEKLADIRRGYEEASQAIEKTAQDVFTRGYEDTVKLMESMSA